MSILLRQPFKAIYIFGFAVTIVFIRLPWWLIYYSWRPNRPRKTWSLRRTILVQMLQHATRLVLGFGIVLDKRDLSLEVPQKELKSLNARFVWIPELEEEDIVGSVAEHAARAGVESIAIPAYWILKEGTEWSPAHEKALVDEKTMLYIHGGGFVVSFFSYVPWLRTNPCLRLGLPIRPIRQQPSPKHPSNIPHLSPEFCRSITESVLGPRNPRTHSQVRYWMELRHTSTLSARWDSCLRTSP